MNKKYVKCAERVLAGVVVSTFGLLFPTSCTKEYPEEGNAGVAHFIVAKGGEDCIGTRTFLNTTGTGNWKVNWEPADEIHYFTGKGSAVTAGDYKKVVPDSVETIAVPVTYKDGDEDVVFYSVGDCVGSVTKSLSSLTITGGVPATQDGTFSGSYVGVRKYGLFGLGSSTPNVILNACQRYVKFSMGSLTVGGKEIKKIVVKDGNETSGATLADVCGTMAVNLGTNAITYSSKAKAITIDKTKSTFYANTDYYVALLPANYASLKFEFYDVGGNRIGSVRTTTGKTVDLSTETTGKMIVDLGEIIAHKRVITSEAQVKVIPPYAAFTKDYADGKKFWIAVEPSDFNGKITLSLSGTNPTAFSLSATTINGTAAKTETLPVDGQEIPCHAVTVSPAYTTDYATKKATLNVKFDNNDGTSVTKTIPIEMGDFIDLGLEDANGKRLLWCRSDIKGSYNKTQWLSTGTGSTTTANNTLTLSAVGTAGDTYRWGEVTCYADVKAIAPTGDKPYGRWNGGVASSNGRQDGGKYTDVGKKFTLENMDNVAYKFNSTWDMPTASEIVALVKMGYSGRVVTSNVVGFTDMKVDISGNFWAKDGYTFHNEVYTTTPALTTVSFASYRNGAGVYIKDRTVAYNVRAVRRVSK